MILNTLKELKKMKKEGVKLICYKSPNNPVVESNKVYNVNSMNACWAKSLWTCVNCGTIHYYLKHAMKCNHKRTKYGNEDVSKYFNGKLLND